MCVIAGREIRATERMIDDVTGDVMRDVMAAVITGETQQIAVDFHKTHVALRIEVLRKCCHLVEMSLVRSCFNTWKTRLSGKTVMT